MFIKTDDININSNDNKPENCNPTMAQCLFQSCPQLTLVVVLIAIPFLIVGNLAYETACLGNTIYKCCQRKKKCSDTNNI